MSNPVWPATLPQFVNQDSYRETRTENSIRTQMEGGALKIRRRFTASFRKFSMSLTMSLAQKAIFDAFFTTSCKDGSLAFDWVLPAEQTAATYSFTNVPTFTAVGPSTFLVTFEIQAMP